MIFEWLKKGKEVKLVPGVMKQWDNEKGKRNVMHIILKQYKKNIWIGRRTDLNLPKEGHDQNTTMPQGGDVLKIIGGNQFVQF